MKLKNFTMITEDKFTEIFCIANDYCKVFYAQMAKYSFYGKKKAQISPWKPHVKGGNHGDNDSLSFIRISLLEAFLSRKGIVNDELKNIAQVEHSRHRSFGNFVVNLLGGIAAYCYFPKNHPYEYRPLICQMTDSLLYSKVYSSNSR